MANSKGLFGNFFYSYRPASNWRLALLVLSAAVAFLPLLSRQFFLLWNKPQYQFFPLVLLGSIPLALTCLGELGNVKPGSRSASYSLLTFSLTLLAAAAICRSAWLASVAALAFLFAAIFAVGGRSLVRALLPAWLFLWFAVPLPFALDGDLAVFLQKSTTKTCSAVLDEFDIVHVSEGSVVCIPGKRLFVDEACSGIQSLYSGLAFTAFLLFWKRRGALHSALLLTAALGWIVTVNIARVSFVAIAESRWHIGAASGWRHELIGYCASAIVVLLIFSSDSLFQLVLAGSRGVLIRKPNLKKIENGPTQFPSFGETALAGWLLTVLLGLLASAEVAILESDSSGESFAWAAPVEKLGEEMLPAEWGVWKRVGFEFKERDSGNPLGHFSQFWKYRHQEREAAASLDYPMQGFHELTVCYQLQGWKLLERSVAREEQGDSYVAAVLRQESSTRLGYLWFVHFDAQGERVEPNAEADWNERVRERLSLAFRPIRFLSQDRSQRATYQVQLFVESFTPLTGDEKRQSETMFREILERLRKGTVEHSKGTP